MTTQQTIVISAIFIAFILYMVLEQIKETNRELRKAMADESEVSKELTSVYKAIAKQNQILMQQNNILKEKQ